MAGSPQEYGARVVLANADVRRKLASIIVKYVDLGERDPVLLSELAFYEVAGLSGSAFG